MDYLMSPSYVTNTLLSRSHTSDVLHVAVLENLEIFWVLLLCVDHTYYLHPSNHTWVMCDKFLGKVHGNVVHDGSLGYRMTVWRDEEAGPGCNISIYFPTSPWKSVSNNAGSSPTEAEIQRCHAQQCMKDSQGTPDLQWDDVNHVNILRLTHADVCQQTCFSENLVLKHFQYIVTSFTSFLRRHPCTSLTSLFCQCPSPTWYLQNVMFQCFTNLQIIVWGKNWKLFVGGAGCLWETSRIIMSEWKQKSGLYCISLQSRFRMKQSIILVEGKP